MKTSYKAHIQDSVIRHDDFSFAFDAAKCNECGGKCCYGESGYIFVSLAEIEEISTFLGISFEDFCLRYIKKVGTRFSLIEKKCDDEKKGISCVFFDEKSLKCSIYDVRPKQCRTFPFWNMYKIDREELIKRCIGIVLK